MADYTMTHTPELIDSTIDKVENLEQTTGQFTTKIMSQKAVTDMVFNPINHGIQIGDGEASTVDSDSISIGQGTKVFSLASTVIGAGAGVNSIYSGAFGYNSKTVATDGSAISFGDGSDNPNYGKRRLINIADPTGAQDSATKSYVDTRKTVLFESDSGTHDAITLSETAENYSYLEIYYRGNDNEHSMTKVSYINGIFANLNTCVMNTVAMYNKMAIIKINVDILTWEYYGVSVISSDGTSVNTATNNIYITKIVGYK